VEFATDQGYGPGYVFYCWVFVGLNPAEEVEGIAEEVRDLNANRWYSHWWHEGDIAAKLIVPANQIEK